MEVSKAKRNGEYDEGGIMKPACGEIRFVQQSVLIPHHSHTPCVFPTCVPHSMHLIDIFHFI